MFIVTYQGELSSSGIRCLSKFSLILEGNFGHILGNTGNEIEQGIDLCLAKQSVECNFGKFEISLTSEWTPRSVVLERFEWRFMQMKLVRALEKGQTLAAGVVLGLEISWRLNGRLWKSFVRPSTGHCCVRRYWGDAFEYHNPGPKYRCHSLPGLMEAVIN